MWSLLLTSLLVQTDVPTVDLSAYRPESGIQVRSVQGRLHVAWPIEGEERGQLVLRLTDGQPLFEELSIARADRVARLVQQADPAFFLTVGSRDLSQQGWSVFFDNPPRRPHETFPLVLQRRAVRVTSQGPRCTIALDGVSAGSFRGELRLTVYSGSPLVHVQAAVSTPEDSRAILYDAGLSSMQPSWQHVAWQDTQDKFQRVSTTDQSAATPVAVRSRTIIAAGKDGALAVFPPPHQFLYPLDFADNFQFAWHGGNFRGEQGRWGLGVRQPPEGDKRFVPWINAPPGTRQQLSVFYLLSTGNAERAFEQVQRFTRGDRYQPLEGYRTFTSHYHIEHTLDFLKRQRDQRTSGVPQGLEEPPFVEAFQGRGVEIVHLAEFHVKHTPEFIEQRLEQLATLHAECRRLSNERFLLLPGEEPNVQLGGHWISFFPKPVYWLLHPDADAPFERQVDGLGTVYAVRNADDVLRLMERERGLMWTAHARTKSSFGFPDRYREQPFYRSDRFLGAAWKAMPADLSLPRLGTRCLDLLDDMANWGQRKYVLGEVDVFRVMPDYELYGHMNVNYLKLDRLPRFEDGWEPVVNALREGKFFVTTGEMLLTDFQVGGKDSGDTLRRAGSAPIEVTCRLQWTFPPAFAEIIWGDGERVFRERVNLTDHGAFGSTVLNLPLALPHAKWVRLEAWDIATNGAFTQPVWVE
jgi:hypothetical protein